MKIQILTCQFGSGHLTAAKNIQAQIQQQHPSATVEIVDLIETCFPKTHPMIYLTYQKLILTGAKLVNKIYGEPPHKSVDAADKDPIYRGILNNLFNQLSISKPDVVIATYSLAAKALARYKLSHPQAFALVTCITDVQAHPGWINPGTDLYLVACTQTQLELVNAGVNPGSIIIHGIPVQDIPVASHQATTPHLLVMGGGLGILPKSDSFYERLSQTGSRITVICGKNKRLYQRLSRLNLPGMTVNGYCDNIPELLAQADLVISKPGGVTTFEAITAEVPLLAFKPTLPQEQSNAKFIQHHELGLVLPLEEELQLLTIESLLQQPQKLANFKRNMRQFRQSLQPQGFYNYLGSQPCS